MTIGLFITEFVAFWLSITILWILARYVKKSRDMFKL